MKRRVRENIILSAIIIVAIIVCVGIVALVYIWKFGLPDFTKSRETISNITNSISNTEEYINLKESKKFNIKVESKGDTIYIYDMPIDVTVYEEKVPAQTVAFKYSDKSFIAVINEGEVTTEFASSAIDMLFTANAVNLGYSAENASYSLMPEMLDLKTFEKDGYELVKKDGIMTFKVSTKANLNLVTKEEIYIKENDLLDKIDILKSRLKYIIIEKPQITFEKNIVYTSDMQYVIYEKGSLTKRTYESLMTLVKVLTESDSAVKYVKENYPIITQNGTLELDGITISLNEKINQDFHYYDMKENNAYMRVIIDIDKLSKK